MGMTQVDSFHPDPLVVTQAHSAHLDHLLVKQRSRNVCFASPFGAAPRAVRLVLPAATGCDDAHGVGVEDP